ncbi:hypothetical protein ASPWEDRAFT_35534 [Aspergillus wentii DTO 134E9]|uniref:Uncharacterized protein n=1 Tax=Aspergillus wentii DTO 134E9 TaxID=1073089 RepID=A0A1L9S422_ASPWE|nr:uncharacterized protein ASPWEDRAFT_35534 [Aspergillus wentii DTO 134E9]KAI9930236.1 hypothetical protein MW887_012048 [Aspergillus wentii]OJJ41912.1 hypothetical protein ASPWEDRAFT_35534 [Aspergillus wentii DTO 134E9]
MVSAQPFPRLTSAEIDGRTQNIRYRQTQFHRLQTTLALHIERLKEAIQTDSGHSTEEIQAEICLAFKEIRTHYLSLDLEKDVEAEYRVVHGKDNVDGKRGTGIVYIVPCTHTMFFSVISAMSAAIAAGNCVIVELTKNTMALPAVLRKILPQSLDNDAFAISEERPDPSFLSKVFTIFQNDSSDFLSEKRLVSPINDRTVAVVDRTANIPEAAQALVGSRFAFGGRSPYSPDVVLVHEFAIKAFAEAVIQHSSKYLAGQNGEARQTEGTTRRSSPGPSLLDAAQRDQGVRVLVSGTSWGVIEVQDRASPLLRKKVNEKVLLLHTITSLDDAIDLSNSNETLAATYAFAAHPAAKYLTQFIDSRMSWINHVSSEMLIGPTSPTNTTPNLETRYSTSLLQVPRPQIVKETSNAALVRAILETSNSKNGRALWNETIAPLPPTRQKAGWKIGFFEQGIITGGVIFLTTVSMLGYYAFTYARRLR